MSKKKIAIVLASTALIASLVIGGTLAYLTDKADVTNTFTMGNIDISLDEEWDSANGTGVLPGADFTKKPVVKAVEGDCYMRIKMQIIATDSVEMTPARVIKIMGTITDLIPGSGDTQFSYAGAAGDATRYYTYNSILTEGQSATLFTNIKIDPNFETADMKALGNYNIVITAEAIQSDNFNNSAAAFTALETEFPHT